VAGHGVTVQSKGLLRGRVVMQRRQRHDDGPPQRRDGRLQPVPRRFGQVDTDHEQGLKVRVGLRQQRRQGQMLEQMKAPLQPGRIIKLRLNADAGGGTLCKSALGRVGKPHQPDNLVSEAARHELP